MKQKIQNQGLTLIEIMVAIAIFSLIFSIISGLFISALKAQKRALAYQELLAQVSYTMEYMSRHLRMACDQTDILPSICLMPGYSSQSYEVIEAGHGIKFVRCPASALPECWEFSVQDGRLQQKIGAATTPISSADLVVEAFSVNLIGESEGDLEQPRVTLFLKIRGKGEKAEAQPIIEIQNTISQRNLDF